MKFLDKVNSYLVSHPNLRFFVKYTALFTMLLLSIAMMSLNKIISTEANPFFYANF